MKNVRLLGSLTIALAVLGPVSSIQAQAPSPTTESIFEGPGDAYHKAVRAYVWGYPLVLMAEIRMRATRPADPFAARLPTDPGAPINQIGHARKLVDPTRRGSIAPNNDTIYSIARLDLSHGPLVLETPDFGSRYYTFSFYGDDSAGVASVGQRTHGSRLPPIFLHGPAYSGQVPDGMLAIASETRYFHMAGRFLVSDPADIAQVNVLQDKLRLRTLADYQAGRDRPAPLVPQRPITAGKADDRFAFLEKLGGILRDWHIREGEREIIADFAAIGLTPDKGFDPSALTAADKTSIAEGLKEGKRLVEWKSTNLGRQTNGWTTNYLGSRFGQDHLLRAGVAKDQILVTIPEEALYPVGRQDSDGRPLTGTCRYELSFEAKTTPPVDAFWSVTLYDDEGQMVPNVINRYSIGDRTPGLARGMDGSLKLLIQANPPRPSERSNWLPAPKGRFYLMMRLYRPKAAVLQGLWSPPRIERVGC